MADILNTSFDSHGNNTAVNETERIDNIDIVYICIFGIAIGVSVLTNTFTIYTLNLTESLQKTENLLYKVLAISDIICAVTQTYIGISTVFNILKGSSCVPMYLCYLFAVYISVFIIVLINVNRFIMIMRPLRHLRLVTPKRLYCALLVGMSGVLVLQIVVNHLGLDSILVVTFVCEEYSSQSNKIPVQLLLFAPILLGFVIIVIANSGIFYKSRQQARKIAQLRRNFLQRHAQPDVNNPQGNHQAVAASGLKGLRTVGALTISYFFVWLPFLISISTFRGLHLLPLFQKMSVFGQLCNTIWNPLILCIANKPFRVASKKVILKMKSACCGCVYS